MIADVRMAVPFRPTFQYSARVHELQDRIARTERDVQEVGERRQQLADLQVHARSAARHDARLGDYLLGVGLVGGALALVSPAVGLAVAAAGAIGDLACKGLAASHAKQASDASQEQLRLSIHEVSLQDRLGLLADEESYQRHKEWHLAH